MIIVVAVDCIQNGDQAAYVSVKAESDWDNRLGLWAKVAAKRRIMEMSSRRCKPSMLINIQLPFV